MESNQNFLKGLALGALLGIAVGYLGSTYLLNQSATCTIPVGLSQVNKGASFISVKWDAVNGANYYTVVVKDSLNQDVPVKLFITDKTSAKLDSLESGKTYSIEVYTVCDLKGGSADISNSPVKIYAKTDFIVIGELPPMLQSEPCPFNLCENVPLDTNGCFNWGTIPANDSAFYRIEITDASGTPVARNYFRRSKDSAGKLNIAYWKTGPCGNESVLNGAAPCKSLTPYLFCGSIPNGAAPAVSYNIQFETLNCCTAVGATGYTIKVSKCHTNPDDVLRTDGKTTK